MTIFDLVLKILINQLNTSTQALELLKTAVLP